MDILSISQHWGIHFTPAVLADYQRYVGRFALDAGADIVVGHHSHILKGIEVYKAKVLACGLFKSKCADAGYRHPRTMKKAAVQWDLLRPLERSTHNGSE